MVLLMIMQDLAGEGKRGRDLQVCPTVETVST